MTVPIWGMLLAGGAVLVLAQLIVSRRPSLRQKQTVRNSKVRGNVTQSGTITGAGGQSGERRSRTLLILGIILAIAGIVEKLTGIIDNLTKGP